MYRCAVIVSVNPAVRHLAIWHIIHNPIPCLMLLLYIYTSALIYQPCGFKRVVFITDLTVIFPDIF